MLLENNGWELHIPAIRSLFSRTNPYAAPDTAIGLLVFGRVPERNLHASVCIWTWSELDVIATTGATRPAKQTRYAIREQKFIRQRFPIA
jgi:hypothetical protein